MNQISKSVNKIPLKDRQARLKVAGAIRMGEKRTGSNGKEYPARLETWRFTSANRGALQKLAEMYRSKSGVREWEGHAGEYEVTLDSSEIVVRIYSPARVLGYKAYDGKQKLYVRVCDGETCTYSKRGEKGIPQSAVNSCLCNRPGQTGELDPPCKLTTELDVIVDGLPSLGIWRLRSGGNNSADELKTASEVILSTYGPGARCILRLETRSGTAPDGKTARFVVPSLDVAPDLDKRVKEMGGVDISSLPGARTVIDEIPQLPASEIQALAASAEPDEFDDLPEAPEADSDGVVIESPRPEIHSGEFNPFENAAPAPETPEVQPPAPAEHPLDVLGAKRAEFEELCNSHSANAVAIVEMARGRGLNTAGTILAFARKKLAEGAKAADAAALATDLAVEGEGA